MHIFHSIIHICTCQLNKRKSVCNKMIFFLLSSFQIEHSIVSSVGGIYPPMIIQFTFFYCCMPTLSWVYKFVNKFECVHRVSAFVSTAAMLNMRILLLNCL